MKIKKITKISNRITIYFSIIIFGLTLAVTASISYIFSKEITKQYNNVAAEKINVISKILNENLDSIRHDAYMVENDKNIYDYMYKVNKNDFVGSEANTEFFNSLSEYSKWSNYISSVIPLTTDKKIMDPLYSQDPYSELIYGNKELDNFIESGYSSKFSAPNTFPFNYENPDYEKKTNITYFSRYLDKENYSLLGYLMINIKKKNLFTNIDDYCNGVFDSTFIVDQNGNLIYKIGNLDYNKAMLEKVNNDTLKIKNEKYMEFNNVIEAYPEWRVIGLISLDSLNKNLNAIKVLIYCIGIFSIAVVIFISHITSRKITDPIYDITKAMNKFENGEWPDKLEAKTEDELKYLIISFNNMIHNMKNLVEQIYKEEEENKKLEVESMKTQLDLLQSQINPHFIHNTLNTINYLAIKNNQGEIREIIQSFNSLLRQSISTNKKLITLKEELTCTQNYLKIQKYRYGDIVKLVCNIPEELCDYLVPKLILQPLVENSLYHGIVPKGYAGTIRIDILPQKDFISIRIIDDGVGISNKKTEHKGFNGISLDNISERLILYFGSEYALKVYSKIGIGTCIEFNIPYID
ncbi:MULTISPECIES: sensor histidine kinase [Clostridium]|uniref:Integral membrane sensor signal transduction histidine kinase n=1 Tax=Clostridium saccharoperbutylacetonicum N1-4(HMT) TaxID=931276 RepID=M1M1J9_9CLOT|nr:MULTISPECIES: sensor histidine kinase [Clostridium]AGF59495.1 integral membrane sensor signal transduction histidine kinase [Clostridium saccharoperbutylacetonicum N1-4(HMT)]AQR98183.1 putative sensor-like histidine kinase [Clostridium saccharoperbutylacetonicum]NRT59711.1 two-component system sensor histidine kinase YesM [Clostridium saccharoperbutylacetonicum]NSB28904.1 two-component system sensor histidine kinase YesM [Clostridium saccharoperbutylacetonicum]NSB34077.1 two-component syste